jgi:lipopolysaccharide heptosyltransferase III
LLASAGGARYIRHMDILFITATRVGDAVLSTGLLSHIIEHYGPARLTIAAGPVAAPLFQAMPGLTRILVVDKRPLSLHWFPLYAAVAPRRWDMVVDLRASAVAWLLRAGERKVIGKGDPREHRVRQLGRLFDLDPPPSPRLWTAAHHEHAAAALIPAGGPVLVIAPAANWRGKEWRPERFVQLTERLTAPDGILPGARVAVMAATHERPQAELLLTSLPERRRIDLVGKVDLPTAAAALRRCSLFVGNDTGLMHLAAASGTPTLGLFGPSPVEQYAPWGPLAAYVLSAEPRAAMFSPGFDHRTTETLMDGLTVDAAEAAARRLWGSVASAAA